VVLRPPRDPPVVEERPPETQNTPFVTCSPRTDSILPMNITGPSETFPNGWLLYDGTCGVCSRFVGGRARFYQRHGFGVVAAQEEWAQKALQRHPVQSENEIRLLRNDGSIVRGANVYREVCKKVIWLRPIYFLSLFPVLSSCFDLGYAIVAANRHNISRICGLQKP
jgi:predicted DCC family thiol-disulfide oxidoreductase YuxK